MTLSDLLPPDRHPRRPAAPGASSTDEAPTELQIHQLSPDEDRGAADGSSQAPLSRRDVRGPRRRRSRVPLVAVAVLVGFAAVGSVTALGRDRTDPEVGITAAPTPPPVPGSEVSGSEVSGSEVSAGAADASRPGAERAAASAPDGGQGAAQGSESPPAAAKSAQLPTRIEDVPDRPARTGSWPALTYTLQASRTAAEPLRFLGALSGFELVDSSASTVTVTENRYFSAVGELPVRTATYDECRRQRFFVRWMALDPTAVVESTFVDEHVRTVQNRPVQGSSGWQSSYGCVQPAMRIRPPSGDAPDRAVVLVETQVWRRG